jgi:UDP-N-acetyl-D-mannosaminuronic acid dehydrogenase
MATDTPQIELQKLSKGNARSMNSTKLKISIVGLGYIGLPTAAVLASVGHKVLGIEVNQSIVEVVNRGEIHIVEPDLDGLVHAAVHSGRLRAALVAEQSDVFIIAVPTPFMNDHQPDLRYIEQAARAIAPQLRSGNLVILESTSPVGTTEKLAGWLAEERSDLRLPTIGSLDADVHVAYCPERVLPGSIVSELVRNDRVVGGLTPRCAEKARHVYETFVRGQCIETDARTAEMTKLTENAFRDVNIAFANEMSLICDRLSINVWELIRLANRHPRVNILNPGPGVGGHCIAVDPWFIVDSAPDAARLIRTAREVNDGKPQWVLGKVEEAVIEARSRHGRTVVVACLGLAFKANIDDLRESPALEITRHLAERRIADKLLVVEPYIDTLPRELAGRVGVELVEFDLALAEADVVVLLVDHQDFKVVPRQSLDGKVVIDTRGQWR